MKFIQSVCSTACCRLFDSYDESCSWISNKYDNSESSRACEGERTGRASWQSGNCSLKCLNYSKVHSTHSSRSHGFNLIFFASSVKIVISKCMTYGCMIKYIIQRRAWKMFDSGRRNGKFILWIENWITMGGIDGWIRTVVVAGTQSFRSYFRILIRQ